MAAQGQAAGGPAGDAAAQQGQQQQGDGHAQAGPDLNALAQQLTQSDSAGQGDVMQFLRSQPWGQQADPGEQETWSGEPPAEADGALADATLAEDPGGELDELSDDPEALTERLLGGFEQLAQAQFAEQAAPLVEALTETRGQVADQAEQLNEQRIMAGYHELAVEFPELGDIDVQEEVVRVSHALGRGLGLSPAFGREPAVIRLVYLATKALKVEAEEKGRPEPPPAAMLEGGGGATPGGGRKGDQFDRALKAKRGSDALPNR